MRYVITAPGSIPVSGPITSRIRTPTTPAMIARRTSGVKPCQRDSERPTPSRECHQTSLARGLLTWPAAALDWMSIDSVGIASSRNPA